MKEIICSGRGSGTNKILDGNTNFWDKFRDFLKQNKKDEYLNRNLPEKFLSLHTDSKKTITNGKNIKTSDASLLLESGINDYNTEEGDPRLVRHVVSCVEKVVVKATDTDAFDYRVISRI